MATSNAGSSFRRKRALVIGNNNYSRPDSKLRHCINDANDLSKLLEKISFKVTTHHDLTNEQMVKAIRDFGNTIVDGDLGRGLHVIDPPADTFVQFACAANKTASDGLETDQNGLFTKHLLKHIANSNEDIIQIFQGVAADVFLESNRKQKPLGMNGILRPGRIYLKDATVIDQ
ncbi:unnamed protein product, partial [Rotaria sp. Silwood1]